MRALARKTGFSASFLSQVELGQCSPSLASLQRMCEALDTDLPDLFAARVTRTDAPVARRSDRDALRSEWSKATAESLVPTGTTAPYSAFLVSLDRGGKTGNLHSRGAHFFAYCIRGRVRVRLEEEPYELAAGDSVIVNQPRATWENAGTTRAELLILDMHRLNRRGRPPRASGPGRRRR